jgi:hypothetical protein
MKRRLGNTLIFELTARNWTVKNAGVPRRQEKARTAITGDSDKSSQKTAHQTGSNANGDVS